jgi:ribosomal protein S18 acetylase RimI-like enzyme
MPRERIRIRLMKAEDLGDVIRIDEKVLSRSRKDYYEQRFELLFKSGEYLPTSLVAENDKGSVVGFIMGELYVGEFGISKAGASIDTIGVDPAYQRIGIGKRLMDEFVAHLKELDVTKINTLVDKNDVGLTKYFRSNKFSASKSVINLERDI